MDNSLIQKLIGLVEANLANENFSREDLAREAGISRSTLNRKLRSILNQNSSQFIREIRLKKAKELLNNKELTVAEISYRVGFGSTTYFNKCFHDYYGYPPGKVGSRNNIETEVENDKTSKLANRKKRLLTFLVSVMALIVLATFVTVVFKPFSNGQTEPEKTIAVMPFEVYDGNEDKVNIADGLLTDIINNLNNIENIKVVPRSTVDDYKNSTKSNQLIAKELMVNYLIYGSVHQLGNRIKINLELIEAKPDTSVWSKTYFREIDETDIEKLFEIQEDVAIKVASILKIKLTEKEEEQISKKPTENLAALIKYQQGIAQLEAITYGIGEDYIREAFKAKKLFEQAIMLDSSFSNANIMLGHIYLNLFSNRTNDVFLASKYQDSAIIMLDKALFYDANNEIALYLKRNCLLSKGLIEEADKITAIMTHDNIRNYDYYEGLMSYYYFCNDNYNTIESYFKYKEVKPEDLFTPEYMIRFASFAFTEAGYTEEAKKITQEILKLYNDSVIYYEGLAGIEISSGYYITALNYFDKIIQIDSTNNNYISQTIVCNIQLNDYKTALKNLQHFENKLNNSNDSILPDPVFGFVYLKNGIQNKANYHFEGSIKRLNAEIILNNLNAQRYISHFNLATIYSAMGKKEKALEYLKMFKNRKTGILWTITSLKGFPMFDNIRNEPEFQEILKDVEAKYQNEHERVGKLLKEQGLI
jgi:TolB-like protein/AraC-like DNA-binding protein